MHTANFIPNGYCKIPVADLLGAPIREFFKKSSSPTEELYQSIPKDDKDGQKSCPRIGQLLYNDPVKILEYAGNEVKIQTPQWTYVAGTKTCTTYWTLISAIAPLTEETARFHPNNIPFTTTNQTIIVTNKPWYNKKTHETYAVGTRFVLTHQKKHSKTHYKVYYTKHTKTKTLDIPRTHAHVEKAKDVRTARNDFVTLLKSWAHPAHESIPYLLGGASYTAIDDQDDNSENLHGFDCSKMITRAAQIVGIPLYAANSSTLQKTLRPLEKNEALENGDIIYFTGHVAVVSNTDKNLLIEARGYSSGNGIVHEIPFYKQFKDIMTTQDLLDAYHAQKKITRLDAKGDKTQTIYGITLLKLC